MQPNQVAVPTPVDAGSSASRATVFGPTPFSFGRAIVRVSFTKLAVLIFAAIFCGGCREHHGDSSASVQQSRSKGIFIAEYAVPQTADLGDCRPIEVWVEAAPSGEQEVIVRLDAPHHGGALRVRIAGFDEMQYRGMWSERNGPPYERWAAPSPLPDKMRLERNGKTIEIQRKTQ